jgi:dTDP-4-amino-4,6-dideoxygalactose transaminase
MASALGVIHAGAVPVLCDVEDGTGLIDLDSAAAVVGERTVAVLPVHLYGQLCDMGATKALAERYGLMVFEDAAQAHGAAGDGGRVGSFGLAAAFSFYPSKNLGALGDGGAVTTDDPEIAERVRWLRDLGQRTKNDHVAAGFNERLDGLQAALLSVKLPHLDEWNAARRRRAATYREVLEGTVRLLEDRGLGAAGIATGIHYSPALHEQPALAGRVRRAESLARAEAWARQEISLPLFPEMQETQIRRVAEACTGSRDARSGRW